MGLGQLLAHFFQVLQRIDFHGGFQAGRVGRFQRTR
jgi:hypothetical protein